MARPHFQAEDKPVFQQGEDTMKFTPRQLSIIWGNDNRYWELPQQETEGPAKLLQVCWLEVTGETNTVQTGIYAISFEVAMKAGAFGWSGCPLFMMAKVGKRGKYKWKRLTIPSAGEHKELPSGDGDDKLQITVESPNQLFFGLYEVWTGRWKGGLEIYNAKVKKIA